MRAADLAEVARQHRAIAAWLARTEQKPVSSPAVFHTALSTQNNGERLEKRTRGVTLEELWAAGQSVERIRERFAASFRLDHRLLPRDGAVFGELTLQLTLAELGF